MSYKDSINAASKAVNAVLGVRCDYEYKDGSFSSGIMIAINQNKEVKGDFGIIAGSYVQASILKSDVEKPRPDDKFTDDENRIWIVTSVIKITTSKTYVEVIEGT